MVAVRSRPRVSGRDGAAQSRAEIDERSPEPRIDLVACCRIVNGVALEFRRGHRSLMALSRLQALEMRAAVSRGQGAARRTNDSSPTRYVFFPFSIVG
jgi:hypothetical protein